MGGVELEHEQQELIEGSGWQGWEVDETRLGLSCAE